MSKALVSNDQGALAHATIPGSTHALDEMWQTLESVVRTKR